MKKNGGPLTQPSPLPEWLSMIERVYSVLEVMLNHRQNPLEFCNKLLQKQRKIFYSRIQSNTTYVVSLCLYDPNIHLILRYLYDPDSLSPLQLRANNDPLYLLPVTRHVQTLTFCLCSKIFYIKISFYLPSFPTPPISASVISILYKFYCCFKRIGKN